MIEKKKQETEKNSRVFHAKKAPNFKDLQEKFIKILDKKSKERNIPQVYLFQIFNELQQCPPQVVVVMKEVLP